MFMPTALNCFLFDTDANLTAVPTTTCCSKVKVNFVASTIATWFVNLPIAYIGGIVLGFGFPALWVGVFAMELFKLLVYAICLSRISWSDMSARAMAAMEVAPEQTPADVEKSAVNYITAVVRVEWFDWFISLTMRPCVNVSTAVSCTFCVMYIH